MIPALAHSMLANMAARGGPRIEGIAPDALQALVAYAWPGNVRQLRNVIERAIALCQGPVLGLDDLPEYVHRLATPASGTAAPVGVPEFPGDCLAAADTSSPGCEAARLAARATLAESKDQVERAIITEALVRNGDNRLRAAAELGISRMTLYKKLHKYGLVGGV
jgi:DNA-binding NtrC family response regulator